MSDVILTKPFVPLALLSTPPISACWCAWDAREIPPTKQRQLRLPPAERAGDDR
jgi:hypothetical protein